MSQLKLNEQIAALRKQKKITQEELAMALGVTNQAVSKWESGTCCPDIQLLPDLASFFDVTIDELMGIKPIEKKNDASDFHRRINHLVTDRETMLNTALAMHAAFFSQNQSPIPTLEGAIDSVVGGKWGYSAFTDQGITTVMRGQSVFYSKNKALDLDSRRVTAICSVLGTLSERKHLTALYALYELSKSEEDYISLQEVAERCMLSVESVKDMFDGALAPFVMEKGQAYHVAGEASMIIPILSLLSY